MSDKAVTLIALSVFAVPILAALLWHAWDARGRKPKTCKCKRCVCSKD